MPWTGDEGDRTMTDTPWLGDACSLVDAYRRGEHSPVDELSATLAAVEGSRLNAVCLVDADAAMAAATTADVSKPFGGVPIAVKELTNVAGWPQTEASVVFADRVAANDSTMITRLRGAGGVIAAQTTSSEFGGVNVTRTNLHGATHNPWQHGKTPGGSSGGSAAAVAGGLFTVATGGDGGGSIRIPAGFCGLVGLKASYGRIPKGPSAEIGNLTAVSGVMARSIRDTARWFDVCSGFDAHDPFSLPKTAPWEPALGTLGADLAGLRVAIAPTWGTSVVGPTTWELVEAAARELLAAAHLKLVDVDTHVPRMGLAWSLSGMVGIAAELGDRWPDCADQLTQEMAFGMATVTKQYSLETATFIHHRRVEVNDAMAQLFQTTDFVMTASNPDVAFEAEGPLPSVFGGIDVGMQNNGRLTFPANLYGCPAIALPAGLVDGLPVSLQIVGPHHSEQLLLELGLLWERLRPWPLVAPGGPH
jgi:aspartyl-tRNA(Asn)/glutamyl-tRNA(Gln) amidotransferase subunit A